MAAGFAVPTIAVSAGWRAVFAVAAVPFVLVMVLLAVGGARSLPQVDAPAVDAPPDAPSRSPVRPATLALALGAALASMSANGISVFLTDSAVAAGLTPSAGGLLLGIASITGVVARIVTGLVADRRPDSATSIIPWMLGAGAALTVLGAIGTAPFLGLGAIGALAAKPVMEGKSVLFKKFAGIDVFDIEIDERDPDKLVEIIASLEPSFGGINLEDIKAPECFYIERKLKERMNIPVFHDDQHGTAIIVAAAITNALQIVGKDLKKAKLVTSGAGAAALACLNLLVDMGMPRRNIWVTDIAGVVFTGRQQEMDPFKERYAQDTQARTLAEVIGGADIFLGLSAPDVLTPEMVGGMSARPVIMA
ncbi:MAG: malic enzyme-like NAD(P)-binding protein, partial [Actinomycetes bacterium]